MFGVRCIVVLTAFMDEGGTDKHSPVLCVAAYVGDVEEWERFTNEWVAILEKNRIDCFHSKERRCIPLRPKLVEALSRRDVQGWLMSVGRRNYEQMVSHSAKSTAGNAYAVCAFMCAMKIARYAKNNRMGDVGFVIEDGQPNIEYVRKTLDAMIGVEDLSIASVTIAKKRQFIPLQAADLLAHAAATHDSGLLEQLRFGISDKLFHGHFSAQDLRKATQGIEEIKRHYRYRKQQAKRSQPFF